jgi:hypothetical protein
VYADVHTENIVVRRRRRPLTHRIFLNPAIVRDPRDLHPKYASAQTDSERAGMIASGV